MKISHHSHIPDRETFETNQLDVLTDYQKEFFGNEINNICSIKSSRGIFAFNTAGQSYNFKNIPLNFHRSANPFVNKNTELLPGIEYTFHYMQIPGSTDKIFLSAEAAQTMSIEAIYETMTHDLEELFNFKHDDLVHNISKMLTPKQSKHHRKGLKEYDPDPTVAYYDFVFCGKKTLENLPKDKNFVHTLAKYCKDFSGIFLFNAEYRVYYETTRNYFLSIEPINTLPTDYSLKYLESVNQNINTIAEIQPVATRQPDNLGSGCRTSTIFILFSILFFCMTGVIFDEDNYIFAFYLYLSIIVISLAIWAKSVRNK